MERLPCIGQLYCVEAKALFPNLGLPVSKMYASLHLSAYLEAPAGVTEEEGRQHLAVFLLLYFFFFSVFLIINREKSSTVPFPRRSPVGVFCMILA